MVGERFKISVRPFGYLKRFVMEVEVIYQTVQVIRFRIKGGERSFEMEKIIVRKTNQWKVMHGSFKNINNNDTQKVAAGIVAIQQAIDNYIRRTGLN